MDNLIINLFDINAIKFGEFGLQSGVKTPVYMDLRVLIEYPKLMNEISELMYQLMSGDVEKVCGVPYTALPLATCIGQNHNIPMVFKRKEMKEYGTKKMIEGVFEKGMTCCIIEDVIVTGISIIETAKELQKVGFHVSETIIVVDRGQGGRENLNNFGITVKSVFTLDEILSTLLSRKKISIAQYQLCREFLEIPLEPLILEPRNVTELDWKERVDICENQMGKKIFNIINTKKTNLCVAADVETMSELLELAAKIAPYICILKIHSDIIHDFDLASMRKLKQMSKEKNFLLMEDRKFADIGNTVKLQLTNKHFDYLSWCDLLTVHAVSGDGVLSGIKSAAKEKEIEIGCFLVAEMSSQGALTNGQYKKSCGEMALRNKEIVTGFVSQSLVKENMPGFIHCTPGVKLQNGTDTLGQNYRSVSDLNKSGFVDIFIVGRGVTEAQFPDEEAARYQRATFPQ